MSTTESGINTGPAVVSPAGLATEGDGQTVRTELSNNRIQVKIKGDRNPITGKIAEYCIDFHDKVYTLSPGIEVALPAANYG